MSYLTDSEIEAIAHLPAEAPYLIRSVSQGYFSVARHYGGATVNGSSYTYFPETDELIRDDVLRLVTNLRKPVKRKPVKSRRKRKDVPQ